MAIYSLYFLLSFLDSVVVMVNSSLLVNEDDGSVRICVDSGITGSLQTKLLVTLSAFAGEGSKLYIYIRILTKLIFISFLPQLLVTLIHLVQLLLHFLLEVLPLIVLISISLTMKSWRVTMTSLLKLQTLAQCLLMPLLALLT